MTTGIDAEEISRERAKDLVDEAQAGYLTLYGEEPVPVIGSVDEDDRETEPYMVTYEFGEPPEPDPEAR